MNSDIIKYIDGDERQYTAKIVAVKNDEIIIKRFGKKETIIPFEFPNGKTIYVLEKHYPLIFRKYYR